ncbi:MAG: hypothetical protein ACLPID_00135 [Beijerinckiaceae bacterium]
MSSAESDPQAGRSRNAGNTVLGDEPHISFWIRELPYSLAFILTIVGVAYTTVTKQPVVAYWALLAPLIWVVCVSAGWRNASDRNARVWLILTQALHWFAFLVAMGIMLLPDVQRIFNANATGLAILTLLALGTFTAGVHIPSWQVCLLGLVMAFCVPAIAWIAESALIYVLLTVTALGIGIVVWWHVHQKRAQETQHPANTG